jgi:hypothetical protein
VCSSNLLLRRGWSMQRIVRTPIGILSLSCPELSDRADVGGAVVSLAGAPAIAE